MSWFPAAVKFPATVRYAYYDGISDTMPVETFPSVAAMDDEFLDACPCRPPIFCPVEIMTTYGDGAYWQGVACLRCYRLLQGYMREDPEEQDGLPPWSPWPTIDEAQQLCRVM